MELNGFFKVERKILEWGWYQHPNTVVVWLYLLAMANIKSKPFAGEMIRRGEVPTSLAKIAESTGLTIRQVRTALEHLKSTGEVTSRARSKYQVITITNYSKYQDVTSKEAVNRQASDKQSTGKRQHLKNDKNDKNEKNVCVTTHIPSRGEVEAYAQEAGLRVDADDFLDYNAARGWKIGGDPVADWKALLRKWAKSEPVKPVEPETDEWGQPKGRREI